MRRQGFSASLPNSSGRRGKLRPAAAFFCLFPPFFCRFPAVFSGPDAGVAPRAGERPRAGKRPPGREKAPGREKTFGQEKASGQGKGPDRNKTSGQEKTPPTGTRPRAGKRPPTGTRPRAGKRPPGRNKTSGQEKGRNPVRFRPFLPLRLSECGRRGEAPPPASALPDDHALLDGQEHLAVGDAEGVVEVLQVAQRGVHAPLAQ